MILHDWGAFEPHLTPYGAPPVARRNICSGGVMEAVAPILGAVVGEIIDPFGGGVLGAMLAGGLGGALGGVAGDLGNDAITGQWVNPLNVLEHAGEGGVGGALGGAGASFLGGAGAGVADEAGGVSSFGPTGAGELGLAGVGGTSAAAAASPFGDIAPGLGGALGTSDIGIGAAGTGAAAGESAIPAGIANAEQGAGLIPGFGGIGSDAGAAAPGAAGAAAAGPTNALDPTDIAGWAASPGAAGAAAAGPTNALETSDIGVGAAGAGAVDPANALETSDIGVGAAGAGGRAAPSASGNGLLNSLGLGGVGKFLKDNKDLLSVLSLGGSLGKSLLFPSTIPGAGTLNANAGLAQNIARQNGTGSLTPQQQQAQQQTTAGQVAAIKSKYASLELSGSTAEQNDIATAENKGVANSAATIQGNASTALNALGVSNAPTLAVANQQIQQDQQLSQAIALLAAAGLYSGGSGASA